VQYHHASLRHPLWRIATARAHWLADLLVPCMQLTGFCGASEL
jgi:hypothetical protein